MGYRLDDREIGVLFMAGGRDFLLHSVQTGSGALSAGVIRLGRKADHPPQPSAQVNTRGSIPPFTLLNTVNKPSGFHSMLGNSWRAERLEASQQVGRKETTASASRDPYFFRVGPQWQLNTVSRFPIIIVARCIVTRVYISSTFNFKHVTKYDVACVQWRNRQLRLWRVLTAAAVHLTPNFP
jgi:hypothetical protein